MTTPITDEKCRTTLIAKFASARMGWTETVVNQDEGKDGGAIVVQIVKGDENL